MSCHMQMHWSVSSGQLLKHFLIGKKIFDIKRKNTLLW